MAEPILTDLTSAALSAAIKHNLYAFFRSFGPPAAENGADAAGVFRWQTAVPHPWFNGLLCSQPPTPAAADAIARAGAAFQARGIRSWTLWLTPELDPGAWSPLLLSRGFHFDDSTPGMAIDLAALPPAEAGELSIEPVEDAAALAVWTATFVRGYGLPEALQAPFQDLLANLGLGLPVRHYLGRLAGQPVAASSLFLGAGVAGLYNVATVPEARGRGFGTALTLAPLHAARGLGYRAGILQASALGYGVYARLGFQHRCQMEHFYWSETR